MMGLVKFGSLPPLGVTVKQTSKSSFKVLADGGGADAGFPSFLPKEIEKIKDPFARNLARRIERLPVQTGFSERCIMSSCVRPLIRNETNPVVLLHCFDSSCLEWRSTYPLLEEAGLEVWAVDILGWGFSDLERRPPCNVASKRHHLYKLWQSHIKRPMILVGPSLGSAVAIDFAVNYPEAVEKLVLINASVYAQGTGNLAKLPKIIAYAGVSLLKSVPLRLYANILAFNGISLATGLDWTNVGRLHCLQPWWEDATVNFMTSGGYNVMSLIKKPLQSLAAESHRRNLHIQARSRRRNLHGQARSRRLNLHGHTRSRRQNLHGQARSRRLNLHGHTRSRRRHYLHHRHYRFSASSSPPPPSTQPPPQQQQSERAIPAPAPVCLKSGSSSSLPQVRLHCLPSSPPPYMPAVLLSIEWLKLRLQFWFV